MNIRSGIKLLEEKKGTGQKIKDGDCIEVKLNCWLNEGDQIQKDHIETIKLGSRILIPGIEYAIEGMRINGKRKVKISPHLGCKDKGVKGLIPPNALLIYEIEILNVQPNT